MDEHAFCPYLTPLCGGSMMSEHDLAKALEAAYESPEFAGRIDWAKVAEIVKQFLPIILALLEKKTEG